MELALLKYSLIGSGVVVFIIASFIFFRLTNWLVWIKGNIPALICVLGGYFVLLGISLMPYVAVDKTHSIMNASIHKLGDGQFKLMIDDGFQTEELIGLGDQWQAKVSLVKPGFFMSFMGLTDLAVLDSMMIEDKSFEKSMLSEDKDIWQREYGVAGEFELWGVDNQLYLTRQLPLIDGAIFGLGYQYGRLSWSAVNDAAKQALKE